ncbi:CdaR family protein [Halobacillus karajensis]|uniref:YbbR-like protein n=1 Tax=Halobacillus karajensis TaxID=195088 RepID=A0A024PA93_9BACI|nr:CdaR family protein [Halobacillus karajensis]CDQ21402.1 YbbR-like protein [Halobacillus karajensis]CDQ25337.1 YbbR-like protein [Halobacillus karajensis]CDQ29661.1 YbbR-like protein [Halobacillus karajensis]
MDNWFRSVWFIRIISLMLAGLLWVTVNVEDNMDSDSLFFNQSSSDVEVIENIPLEIRFDSAEYVVSGIPQEVSVSVEGPTSAVAPVARQKNFTVYVDLNGLGPGTHEVSLQHSGISNQLAVTLDPKNIEVTIEEKVTQDHEVNIDYSNQRNLDANLELGEPDVSPQEVSITGASSVIERVASVKAIIDVGEATESIEAQEAPVKVYDNQGNELNVLVEPTAVNVDVPITKRMKSVPINVVPRGGNTEGVLIESVSTETEEVTISGPQEVLDEIDELPEVPVDVSEITEDQTVEVDIPLPEGATSVDPETIDVDVEVGKSDGEDQASEGDGNSTEE